MGDGATPRATSSQIAAIRSCFTRAATGKIYPFSCKFRINAPRESID